MSTSHIETLDAAPASTNESSPKVPGAVSWALRPIRARLLLAALLAAGGGALVLVPLAVMAWLAKALLAGGAMAATPWPAVGLALASLVAGQLLISGAEWLAHLADNRLTGQLRLDAVRRLARVPLGWFTERASGEVKQALQDDVGTLHALTAHFYTTAGRAAGAIAASLVYLFIMDWRMALVSMLPFAAFFFIIRRLMAGAGHNMAVFVEGTRRINNAVVEFVSGIPVVKTFGDSGRAHRAYREAIDDFLQAFVGLSRPMIKSFASANALVAPVAVLGLVLAVGTGFVALGWMQPVDVLPFALVAPGLSAPLLLLFFLQNHQLASATAAAERVRALLATPALAQPAAGAAHTPADNAIRLDNVAYRYDDGTPALTGITLELPAGSVTAVVGASGSGKSTLARLLLRFFDPTAGRITLGGVDLRQMDTSELYRRIGFVLQDVRLIHASVRDNIALGRPGASQEEIEQAAHAANIHQRIMELPHGYDAVMGEDVQLSGGEQQRISIARAVLLDPPVLVLDEATAAADADNEAAIQEALSRFARGRTVLVIAHRLDTIAQADHIVVLERGRMAEQGCHGALMAQGGRYARLWQMGGYADMTPSAPANKSADANTAQEA